jgi:hypothetical protein
VKENALSGRERKKIKLLFFRSLGIMVIIRPGQPAGSENTRPEIALASQKNVGGQIIAP